MAEPQSLETDTLKTHMLAEDKLMLRVVLTFAAALTIAAPAAAQQYSAQHNGDVVTLQDTRSQTAVSVDVAVGNIGFELKVKGQNVLYWPFTSVEDFKMKPTMSGIPFLAPFANRLDETAFYSNGRKYAFDMTLGNVRGPIPIHGFVTTTDQWHVVEVKADSRSAWVTSRLEFARQPMWMKQWPFAHTIEMTYRLQDGVLEVQTLIVNHSADAMPVAVGFHPYYKLTDSPRDEWTLSVGARRHWRLAENKVPTGETEPIEKVFPNPQAVSLRAADLDDDFDDLVRDPQGRATMSIAGKVQRLAFVLGPNYRSVVIWAPKDRDFICVEPMAGMTNAINMAHKGQYKELQTIAPGGKWQESFWVRPTGF